MENNITNVWLSQKGTPITSSWRVAESFNRRHSNLTKSIRTMMASHPHMEHHFHEQEITTRGLAHTRGFVMDETGFNMVVRKMTDKNTITGVWETWRNEFAAVAGKTPENAPEAARNEHEQAANVPDLFVKRPDNVETPTQTNENVQMSIPDLLRAMANEFESFMSDVSKQLDELKHRMDMMAEMKPAQESHMAVVPVGNAISVNELAKMMVKYGIQIGEIRLYEWLRSNGYLCSIGADYNLPTQKSSEMGLFIVEPGSYTKPNGQVVKTRTTRVTDKGQIYFVNKFIYNANR